MGDHKTEADENITQSSADGEPRASPSPGVASPYGGQPLAQRLPSRNPPYMYQTSPPYHSSHNTPVANMVDPNMSQYHPPQNHGIFRAPFTTTPYAPQPSPVTPINQSFVGYYPSLNPHTPSPSPDLNTAMRMGFHLGQPDPRYSYSKNNLGVGAPSYAPSMFQDTQSVQAIAPQPHLGPGPLLSPGDPTSGTRPGPVYQTPGAYHGYSYNQPIHQPPSSPQPQHQYGSPFFPGFPRFDEASGTWYFVPAATPPAVGGAFDSGDSYMSPDSYGALQPPAETYSPIATQSPYLGRGQSNVPPPFKGNPGLSGSTRGGRSRGGSPRSPVVEAPLPNKPHAKPIQGPSQGPRRSYHPNPPATRSEWVMWCGNIPSDCTHDELWHYLHSTQPSDNPGRGSDRSDPPTGIVSIFLISQSNCAFVNFDSDATLARAVTKYNGQPLRPHDPRCLKMVCRVRKREEDLKSGVGAQRGMGMHTRWINEQKSKEAKELNETEGSRSGAGGSSQYTDVDDPPTSPSTHLRSSSSEASPPIPAFSEQISLGTEGHRPQYLHHDHSSGDVSFASTTSSFLQSNYPQRYFILKSLTQHDLNLSVERKMWATQPHNEPILDQAFRTSQDVFLIFGANKSGEFFGYAKMAGPISSSTGRQLSWTSRSEASLSSHRSGWEPGKSAPIPEDTHGEVIEEPTGPEIAASFLSPRDQGPVQESPAAVTPGSANTSQLPGPSSLSNLPFSASAPAQMGGRRQISALPRKERPFRATADVVLDTDAPIRAIRHKNDHHPQPKRVLTAGPRSTPDIDNVHRIDTLSLEGPPTASGVEAYLPDMGVRHIPQHERAEGSRLPPERPLASPSEQQTDDGETWGTPFLIDWIKIQRLPFQRTRHLRNPWNNDREVKVSRDGTELEPKVGARLLAEWDDPAPPSTGLNA